MQFFGHILRCRSDDPLFKLPFLILFFRLEPLLYRDQADPEQIGSLKHLKILVTTYMDQTDSLILTTDN